jgi:transcriptional regulator with AAA-type ATPase domain
VEQIVVNLVVNAIEALPAPGRRVMVSTRFEPAECCVFLAVEDEGKRVTAGLFRKDLYYRLRAHHTQIPPLRARREDLPLLINHFLEKAAQALHQAPPNPTTEV